MFKSLAHQHNSHEDVQRELAAKYTNQEQEKSDDDLLSNARLLMRKTEAMIQADLAGNQTVHDAIMSNNYSGPLPERRDDGGWLSVFENLRILKIAGINRREGIDRYVGRVDCALVPEPDNEFDPEAIKIVADDRHHLGYIPADQTTFVRSLTAEEFPYKATAFIEEKKDEVDGHRFFVGYVYIKRLD
jgi:hypothetical protein